MEHPNKELLGENSSCGEQLEGWRHHGQRGDVWCQEWVVLKVGRLDNNINQFIPSWASTTMKEQNSYQEQVGQYAGSQDIDNEGQKLFLPKCTLKRVPVGSEFHQCEIPQMLTFEEFQNNSDSIIQTLKSPLPCQTFKASNIPAEEVDEYLRFVQEFYLEKDPDVFTQEYWGSNPENTRKLWIRSLRGSFSLFSYSGTVSKHKIFPKALELLHKCKYNVVRAKFSITFPYYITFNRLRPQSAIKLTDEEMETKMKKHKEGLRRTREKDEEKWAEEVLQRIEEKVDLHTLISLIEAGKQNKYDLPQNVKELIDRATKFGKELKKMISQSNKVHIERLLQKMEQLNGQRIITNEMNVFESTVTRCVEWTKKALEFNHTFFILVETPDGPIRRLKKIKQKIQFKHLSNLVEEYNSLPLVNEDFEGVKFLYDETLELLDRLPQFAKSVKTRNQNVMKISIEALRGLEEMIQYHPVKCDEFDFFTYQTQQNLQFIERISMMLEDERTEKTVKLLSSFLKQAHDIPIQSNVMSRLQNYIQYIGLMEKIRKDILVFSKFEQTEENIRLAYEKGFVSAELADYQAKLDVYKNWFNTTQKFSNRMEYTKIDIVKKENEIISNMIEEGSFKQQLVKAKEELKIDEGEIQGYYEKLAVIEGQKEVIRGLLEQRIPDLEELATLTLTSIEQGLKYPEFLSLFVLTRRILIDIADFSFLLNQHGFSEEEDLGFFTIDEHEEIVAFFPGHKKQLRELTKTEMELMLQETTIRAFPTDCFEWQMFKSFIDNCSEQEERASQLISTYNRLESFEGHSEQLFHEIEELLRELKGMLVSDSLIKQLNEIMEILKCRRVIDTKICLEMKDVFTPTHIEFIERIREKLGATKELTPLQRLKSKSLKFQSESKTQLADILHRISIVNFEKPLKLSEINRVQKEIERIELDSLQLRTMKKELSTRYENCESWRASMLDIKNRKKPKKEGKEKTKDKDSLMEKKEDDVVEMEVEGEEKEKEIEKQKEESVKEQENDSFFYYFKFPLLVIKFYQGLKLKTNLQQLSRLKAFICDVGGFITKFDILQKNPKPLALQISDLNSEGNKWNSVFLLEKWKISRRNQYVMQWRNMAILILDSMPILRLEQRAILLVPEQPVVKDFKVSEEIIEEEHQNEAEVIRKQNHEVPVEAAPEGKRKRKLNPFYNNEQITLFVEDLMPLKPKKKKKVEEVSRRKTESKRSKKVEVIEYIEHIESVYCICRLGLMNQSSIMLQCEVCERWFHTECVGIRKSYVRTILAYFCPGCCKRYELAPDYFKSFYWESNRKMSEENFRYLVNEGHEMNVILEQLSHLLTLEGRIDMWKAEVEKTVRAVLDAEAKGKINDSHAQASLFNLYIQSLWLPTIHVETDVLLTLLKKHDTPQRLAEVRRQASILACPPK